MLLYDLFFSSIFVISNFVFSSSTAYFLCKFQNIPFLNPNYNIEKKKYTLKNIFLNILIYCGTSIPLKIFFFSFLENKTHDFYTTIILITEYILLLEFIYYNYHRFLHSKKIIYNLNLLFDHYKHHENRIVYPNDTFYISYSDSLGFIISLLLPLLLLKMNYYEFYICLYFYITCSYLSHSNYFYRHHYIHHKYYIYNFCLIFPIFDILFNTYNDNI